MIFLRKLHKWLGLVVGLQLLLWTVSGLVFAWLDHHEVMGEHSAHAPEPPVLPAELPIAEPSTFLDQYAPEQLYEVRLMPLLDLWVWRIEHPDRVELRHADDGTPLQIDEAFARALALAYYAGDGRLESVAFHATPTLETRRAGAVWEARFSDDDHTTLYFSADDGRLVATRNSTWRVFDFFWMLHTMDYEGRDDFNHPLVITAGTGAVWLTLSGLLLLVRSFRKEDFDLVGRWRRRHRLRVIGADRGDEMDLEIRPAGSLFAALAGAGIELPSNCGGGGTCGLCVVRLGPDAPAPTAEEQALIARAALDEGVRLACRQRASVASTIELPDAVLRGAVREMEVVSTRFLTPFIKELTLQTADREPFEFRAGSYVQIEVPAGVVEPARFEIPRRFAPEWSRLALPEQIVIDRPFRRAYSMANFPGELSRSVRLNVRFALPPPGTPDAPVGRGAAYLFSRRPGDRLRVHGPFGTFRDSGSAREKIFIGGGAGMAPLRSIVFDLLRNQRSAAPISFWYGARNRRELFYQEDFVALAREHRNFKWYVALSEPSADDDWAGPVGYIHDVVRERYLFEHLDPAACEYYLCGPPQMLQACRRMLERLGVPGDQVFFDDFGI